MLLWKAIENRTAKIAVIGLGYVGMPLAVSFSKVAEVIGFDISADKIRKYKQGIDPTNELGNQVIKDTSVEFTSDEQRLREAKFYIIAVPTPVNLDKTPDLTPVISASKIVAHNLQKGSIVVYESTVYPGVTEEVCISILEKESGLVCGIDFKVGYSPERINPGDKLHRLENIKKIVSGMDAVTLEEIRHVYEMIIIAGVHCAPSIKVAEAAKVVENSQRDINIAFMNELAMVFDRMGIATVDVLAAMQTKWNALPFKPGLVGGHCIGVDPYYFVYQAEKLGYHSQVILAGRKINDGMGSFVADVAIRKMILAGRIIKNARVAVLGLTFKENCPDIRNSKVMDIVKRLNEYEIYPLVADPYADKDDAKIEYGINLVSTEEIENVECVILAVGHDVFKTLQCDTIDKLFPEKATQMEKILIDVKGILNREEFSATQYTYWSL